MQALNNKTEQEHYFSRSLKELEKVTKILAKLNSRKEELNEQIICALQHEHEGQKTYEYNEWKIEVKTPFIYSLNKSLYESGKINIPGHFNPVKTSVSYTVDKRLCDKFLEQAPFDVRDALIELIDKKPGKPSVTLKARVS